QRCRYVGRDNAQERDGVGIVGPLPVDVRTDDREDDQALQQIPHSLAPDGSDTFVGDRGVNDCIRDRAMAHEGLQGPCIDSPCRQGVAGSMAQHVSMYSEWQLSSLA